MKTTVLDSSGEFKDKNKIIGKSNYITFGLSSDLMSFYIYVIFIDEKGSLIPIYYPNYKKYSDVWGYYFDYENESFVAEERLSYNTGPYVLSVLKIKNHGLINAGSLYNNHENYSKFNSIDSADNFIFDRMMKESSLKNKVLIF